MAIANSTVDSDNLIDSLSYQEAGELAEWLDQNPTNDDFDVREMARLQERLSRP